MADKSGKSGMALEYDGDGDPLEVEHEDISELMDDVDSELDSVTSEFGKDKNDVQLKIKLHRVLERKGEREWLFDILPSELPILDRVKDEYGGGKYEASLFKNGKLFRKFNFNIANPRLSFVPKNNQSDLLAIANMMATQQEKQFAQLKELMQVNKPVQSFNTLEMITGVITLMGQMKNLFPQPAPSDKSVDLLLKGMELMKDFTGDKGESSLIDVFRDLIKSPLLEKAIEGTASHVPNPTLANPALLNPAQISATKPGEDKMNLIVRGYLNQLIKKAAQNSDPELYAAFILDNVPEKTVREYLLREDLMAQLTAVNPQAAQYTEWFNELKNNIVEMLAEDNEENLTDGGESADTSEDASESATSDKPDGASAG